MNQTALMGPLDRLVSWSDDQDRFRWTHYPLATIIILAVAVARVMFVPATLPWLLFIPATIAITLAIGRSPGIYVAALSTIAGLSTLRAGDTFASVPRAQWIAAVLFLVVLTGLVLLTAELRDALNEARRLNAELLANREHTAEREAFLSGVLASSTDCIKVLDLQGRLTFMSDGGQRVMEVSDFNAIVGCPWPDFWQGAGNAEAQAAIEAARHGKACSFIGKADTFRGMPKWWHVAVSPILGPDGQADRILSVSRDITELRESEQERERFVRLVENSTDFVGMADLDGRVFFMNDAARRIVGLEDADYRLLSIADFFAPDELKIVSEQALPAVAEHGNWSGDVSFRHFGTGELIPMHYTLFPITDATGEMIGYGTVTRDIRERKRAEEDMLYLNGELAHRLKNVLSVIQSVAQQTLRNSPDTATAAKALSARLVALGGATDVLTGKSWRSADLHELAQRTLAPHGAIGERIILDGPPVVLKPEVSVAFALALHELATNAAKYGALSNEDGVATLRWSVDGIGDDAGLTVQWQESGGPLVTPPQRKGFGSALIERSMRSFFTQKSETEYRPEGLVLNLKGRLDDTAVVAGK